MSCTPRSRIFWTLWSNISANRIRVWKYYSLFIRGRDGFISWKKMEVENLMSLPLRRIGGNISVDLSLSVYFITQTSARNKLQFNDFLKCKTKNNSLTVLYKLFFVFKITPLSTQRKGFHLRKRKRKRVFCWSRLCFAWLLLTVLWVI